MDVPPNALWSAAFVDALVAAGVGHVCVSPGSRSSPLTLAVADRSVGAGGGGVGAGRGGIGAGRPRPYVTTSVHIDERSAGFFALGYGRATGQPAAVVCTSGTAAANYLPAVIEAHYSRVPLIVLTADRPPELRDTGAWQAIDQLKLYGAYVRWFAEVATPDASPAMLRYVRDLAGRAMALAAGRPAGPVHLNFPFREPLVTDWAPAERAAMGAAVAALPPPVRAARTVAMAHDDVLSDLAARIAAEPRGLIVCGTMDPPPGYAAAVVELAAAAGYPVLAEPTSGLRFGPHARSHVVTGYDAFLRQPDWCDAMAPGLVLRFGSSLTWKYVAQYLERHPGAAQVVVDPDGTWDDPTRLAALRVPADPVPLCHDLAGRLAVGGVDVAADVAPDVGVVPALESATEREGWRTGWLDAAATARRARDHEVANAEPGSVAWVYPAVIDALPDGALLYAANSMAVRDLDTFTDTSVRGLRAIANRGAAGIDGTLSSALGAAFGSASPTVLLTGDLAFLHDLNGLGAAHLDDLNLTVIVLNDQGGGIFEYLPVAEQAPEAFERFFVTPPGADLAAACATYGVAHAVAEDPATLGEALRQRLATTGVQVIEVPVDRAANTAAHRRYWSAVGAAALAMRRDEG